MHLVCAVEALRRPAGRQQLRRIQQAVERSAAHKHAGALSCCACEIHEALLHVIKGHLTRTGEGERLLHLSKAAYAVHRRATETHGTIARSPASVRNNYVLYRPCD